MKKLSPIAYRALFFKHVWRFMKSVCTPMELSQGHAIAVSGGLDSMTLLWFAKTLENQGKIGPVRAVFVHHHTRSGQKGDGELVEKFCLQENIPFKALHVEGLSSLESNFEARARKIRRDLCRADLGPRELLWAGHHLDDSYEWSMMQKNRSTNPRSVLGIPVRNLKVVRPFLCVTRAQLKKLCIFEGITYRDDPSNLDLRFDRNFVRHKIIPNIKKRFPKYLKHYAQLSNFSSMMLKVNLLNRSGSICEIFAFEQGAILKGKHFSELQIQELLHVYSNTDRGEIITPIQRMLMAIENKKKGPFQFSGGMEIYHSHRLMMIYRQGFKNYDESIAKVLSTLTREELNDMPYYNRVELNHAWNNLLKSTDALLNMPGYVLVLETDSLCKTLNTSVYDPLFPKVSAVCKERGLRFISFLKCLDMWEVKKQKLPETLRLLPLCNLSNLFSSQA